MLLAEVVLGEEIAFASGFVRGFRRWVQKVGVCFLSQDLRDSRVLLTGDG